MKITGLDTANFAQSIAKAQDDKSGPQKGGGFQDMLSEAVNGVNDDIVKAQNFSQLSAAGEPVDTVGTMIASAKADISFNLFVQLRNKVLSAYENIMGMQF